MLFCLDVSVACFTRALQCTNTYYGTLQDVSTLCGRIIKWSYIPFR